MDLQKMFSGAQMSEMKENFDKYSEGGKIKSDDLEKVMKDCGEDVPQFKIRKIVSDVRKEDDESFAFNDFLKLFAELSPKALGGQFKQAVGKTEGVKEISGSEASSSGTKHSFSEDEQAGFANWINSVLEDDNDLQKGKYIPIEEESADGLFKAVKDGVLLCKLINWAVPNTVDERAINKTKLNVYNIHENQVLALNSARAIGCNIVNIGAEDLIEGKPHLVLGLLWQIIRIGLFARITVRNCPGMVRLLEEWEVIDDLLRLPPEIILLRWFNYHLKEASHHRTVTNFSTDISDSENYSVLLKQISPSELGVDEPHLRERDVAKLAELVLQNAKKMKCAKFVRVKDIVKGNTKLNLAFVCNLFNTYPALEPVEEDLPDLEETREEKTFRNWMNSLGVKPFVNNLYMCLEDGNILLQLFEQVKPGIVDWKKVNLPPFKKMSEKMKKVENCNYAIKIAEELKFSLVGIGGQDIYDRNKKLTLALLWQTMRAYTMTVLEKCAGSGTQVTEAVIVTWVNDKLKLANKMSSITGFKDPSISTSQCIIDLVDAIQPGAINYKLLVDASDEEGKMMNAKYAISMARKTGASLYALPEDVVEVNPKMVLTVFACIMAAATAKEKIL